MSRTPAHVRQAQQSVARAVARALVDRVAAWRTCCSRRPSRELLGSAIGGGDSAFADAAPPARLWSLLLAAAKRLPAPLPRGSVPLGHGGALQHAEHRPAPHLEGLPAAAEVVEPVTFHAAHADERCVKRVGL